jgi:hypothetical protein
MFLSGLTRGNACLSTAAYKILDLEIKTYFVAPLIQMSVGTDAVVFSVDQDPDPGFSVDLDPNPGFSVDQDPDPGSYILKIFS